MMCFPGTPLCADTPAQWASRAEQLIRSGDTQAALAALSKATAIGPSSADSEDKIGFLLAVLGRNTEALEHFQKSIALDPRYARAHFHLGAALWLAKDPDRAMPELQEAARLSPTV